MKVPKYLLATLTATAILAGCQEDAPQDDIEETSDEEAVETTETATVETGGRQLSEIETDDASLSAILEQAETIESYEASLDLTAAVDGGQPETLEAEVRFKDGEPPSLHLMSEGEDRTISKDGTTFYNNGTDWIDISDSVNVDQLYHVTYRNAILSFADIKNELESEESGDQVIYTLEGQSDEVFETFEELFAVEFGNIDTSEIENDLEIAVGKEDSLIQSINYDAQGEDTEGAYELSGEVEFTSFNDVDEIELPEAVQ
ncbi:hypothetical protein ACFOLA_05385 [Salinicoccus hispanicus]|uniref:LppX_LprAFG lipoprotein n=1 Tax=Salinicoccus hispanicus TaxID=157225 RepID=A0A6N8U410_9STAP|nr:hypothetical protein [Salinicoccus hispanicus]MXQ51195.1 hypothetical protein [Salinicoccus hispanicus]